MKNQLILTVSSAYFITASRCVTKRMVLSFMLLRMLCRIFSSVSLSSADVASSMSSMGDGESSALAMQRRCA